MSDLMLTNGDLVPSVSGDLSIISGGNEVIQSAIDHILTRLGELELHKDIGNDALNRRSKITQSELNMISAECKTAILQDARVTDVINVTATSIIDDNTETYGKCYINFTLKADDDNIYSSDTILMLNGVR